jgi:hypothetical protein
LQKVLAGAGAMYSHVNDDVLAESLMEKERLSKSASVRILDGRTLLAELLTAV